MHLLVIRSMPGQSQFTKLIVCLAAVAAAACVLTVLITPAPDELPSTAPHALHYLVFVFVTINPVALHTGFGNEQIHFSNPVLHSGTEWLSFTCTRLC